MRVNYKYGIRTISGKLDDLVHMAWNKGRVAIARRFSYPTLVAQHSVFKDIGKNIAEIWDECSEDFKNDLHEYTLQRIPYYSAEQIPAYSGYANFVRFIHNFCDEHPEINMAETTKSDLELEGCPTTVTDAMIEGYLPDIEEVTGLTNSW